MTAISIHNLIIHALKEYVPTTISTYHRTYSPYSEFMTYEIYVTCAKQKIIEKLNNALSEFDIFMVKNTKNSSIWECDDNLVKATLIRGTARKGTWNIHCLGPRKSLPPLSFIYDDLP